MIYTQVNFPQAMRWQQRMSRLPRWAWIAFFAGALIPIVAIVALAIFFGIFVLAAVLIVGAVVGLFFRLLGWRRRRVSNRGEIVVSAVRVVDP